MIRGSDVEKAFVILWYNNKNALKRNILPNN